MVTNRNHLRHLNYICLGFLGLPLVNFGWSPTIRTPTLQRYMEELHELR